RLFIILSFFTSYSWLSLFAGPIDRDQQTAQEKTKMQHISAQPARFFEAIEEEGCESRHQSHRERANERIALAQRQPALPEATGQQRQKKDAPQDPGFGGDVKVHIVNRGRQRVSDAFRSVIVTTHFGLIAVQSNAEQRIV